jgi:rhodanese-related sulfurtransferase
MEATRVTVDELKERMDRGEPFALVDCRNPQAWGESEQKLPNAIRVPADELDQHTQEIPHDRAVITYCTCPHEASSARVAQDLAARGWKNVHPLYGGFEAWQKAGLPLDAKAKS